MVDSSDYWWQQRYDDALYALKGERPMPDSEDLADPALINDDPARFEQMLDDESDGGPS